MSDTCCYCDQPGAWKCDGCRERLCDDCASFLGDEIFCGETRCRYEEVEGDE